MSVCLCAAADKKWSREKSYVTEKQFNRDANGSGSFVFGKMVKHINFNDVSFFLHGIHYDARL